jgi:adenylate cyclase class IV
MISNILFNNTHIGGKSDKEIEWRWVNINIDNIRKMLKKNKATLVQEKIIMPLMVFTHPNGNKDSYIRIRHEGKYITMTSKTDLNSEFVTEYEIIIDSFTQGIKILYSLGCKKRYYVEKLRETWNMPDCK